MSGWFKVHRELFEKPIWKKSTLEQRSILLTLLKMASWEERQEEFNGTKIMLKPGQMITSSFEIAHEVGNGVGRQPVRTAIERFKKLDFLTTQSTKSGTLITITNWESYQGKDDYYNHRANQNLTNGQPTGNQLYKGEEREELEETPPTPQGAVSGFKFFKKFWKEYPKQVGEQACYDLWVTKQLDPRFDEIMAGLKALKASEQWTRDDGRYIPNPARFLKENRWKDQVKPTIPAKKAHWQLLEETLNAGGMVQCTVDGRVFERQGLELKPFGNKPGSPHDQYLVLETDEWIVLSMFRVVEGLP